MAEHHSLVLVDRGVAHRHRFRPVCGCGWAGTNHRRVRHAEAQYHDHETVIEALAIRGGRRRGLRPLPPTSPERIPALLR